MEQEKRPNPIANQRPIEADTYTSASLESDHDPSTVVSFAPLDKAVFAESTVQQQATASEVSQESYLADTLFDQEMDDLLGPELMAILGRTPSVPPEEPAIPEEPAPIPPSAPSGEYVFPTRRPRKKTNKGTKLFYSIYAAVVAVILIAFIIVTIPLHNWLVNYEASQPKQQCQEVFDLIFAKPDWAVIYDLAEISDTDLEGKETYVRYMNARVAAAKEPQLRFVETSAGLSGDHKYLVKLDEEKIASFTLVNSAESGTPNWKLGTVEVFLERSESFTVLTLPGYTTLVNGKPLDESYTVRKTETLAETYLPEGTHGYRQEQQYVSGLLMQPESVTVLNETGTEVATTYDEATNTYQVPVPSPMEMTEEERQIALKAAEANSLFAIRAIGTGELRSFFDANSQIYKDIVSTPVWMQGFSKYEFDDSVTAVSDFYRYSDKLFSARVTMTLNVTRKNGTVKPLETNTTYFFTKSGSGSYLVTNITNVMTQDLVEQVRLSFIQDGKKLDSFFVSTHDTHITLPTVTAPEGQVLRGWAQQTTDDKGNVTMTILFAPDANNQAAVPENWTLEPTTLYAVFEKEGADAQ